MTLEELYRASFDDNAAFTEHFFHERGGFPVTVEERGEPVSMAFVTPKLLRIPEFHNTLFGSVPPRRDFDGVIRVAMIGGVCTHPAFRRQGYASRVVQKTIAVCKELGFEALFLNPFDDTFYHQFGFVDVEYAERIRIRNSKFSEFTAHRYRDAREERHFNDLGIDEVGYHIMTAIQSFNADKVGLAFTAGDLERLADEADTGDGLYLVTDTRTAVGAVYKDGDELQYVWMRGNRADYILSKTAYRGENIFGGCTMDRISSEKQGLNNPRVYMQALIFDPKTFEEKLTGYRGFYDPALYQYLLFEQY